MSSQCPVETIFCFICSSNNNIARITQMINHLCEKYGDSIQDAYAFPSISDLTGDHVENELRGLGFGYRAKYVVQTARLLLEKGGHEYIDKVLLNEKLEYEQVKQELLSLAGGESSIEISS